MACFGAFSRLPPIDLAIAQTNVATEMWDVGVVREVRFSDSLVADVCYLDAKDPALRSRLRDFAAQGTFAVYTNASFQRVAIGSEQGVVVVDRVTDEQAFQNLIGLFESKVLYEAHESVWRSELITACDQATLERLEGVKGPFQGNEQPMWLALAYGQFMFTFPTVICQVCVDALEAAALRLAIVEAQPPKRRTARAAMDAPWPAFNSQPVNAFGSCPLCGHMCGSGKEKRIHVLQQHFFNQLSPAERWFDERSPACPFCGSYLWNEEAMLEHMLDQHQEDLCLKMRWQQQSSIRIQDIERVIAIIMPTYENKPIFDTFPDMDQMEFVPTAFEPVAHFARVDDAAPTKPVTRKQGLAKPLRNQAPPKTSVAEKSSQKRPVLEEPPAAKAQAKHLAPEPPMEAKTPAAKAQAKHLAPEPPVEAKTPAAKAQAKHLAPEPPMEAKPPAAKAQAKHLAPEPPMEAKPPAAKAQAKHLAPEPPMEAKPPAAKAQAKNFAPEQPIEAEPPAENPGNYQSVPQEMNDSPPGFGKQNDPFQDGEEEPDELEYLSSIASSIRTKGLDVSNVEVQISDMAPIDPSRLHTTTEDDVVISKCAWSMLDCLDQKLTILGKVTTEPVCQCHICNKSCSSYVKLLQHCWNHHREYLKVSV